VGPRVHRGSDAEGALDRECGPVKLQGPTVSAAQRPVTTVKSHIRMLYTKLAVGARRAAVETARSRGLLRPHARADP